MKKNDTDNLTGIISKSLNEIKNGYLRLIKRDKFSRSNCNYSKRAEIAYELPLGV